MSWKINLGVPEFILKMGNPNGRYVYEFGDFRLDAGHRMLYHKDEELALAPKAVETLVALVARRGEIMSKDELLGAVWPDAVVEESNLFVYLSVLRKSLGTKTDGKPWVETLRRRGYRFSGDVRVVPAQNGIPHIRHAALTLVPATPTFPLPEPTQVNAEDESRRGLRRTVFIAIGLAVVLAAVTFTYQYVVNPPIDSIASKLRSGLWGVTDKELSSSPAAYDLYLKGRFFSLKLTQPEIDQGIDYLYQAVEKDPAYAMAYAKIARAHLILGIAGERRPSEFIRAKDAAQRAIKLDESLAEGYSALAGVAFFYDWNFTEAENLYKHALELDPNNPTAHQQYADFLYKTGRPEEGATEIARARELDPDSVFINAFYAVSIRDNDDALEQIRFAMERGRDYYLVHMFAAEIYRRKEMYDESVSELRRAKELSPQQTWSDVALVGALKHAGKIEEARLIADGMLRDSKIRYIPPTHLALAYKQLGDDDKVFTFLEEGFKGRDPKMVFLNEPRWNDREDPQFQALLRRIGFAL